MFGPLPCIDRIADSEATQERFRRVRLAYAWTGARLPSLGALRAFAALAETGSFAARRRGAERQPRRGQPAGPRARGAPRRRAARPRGRAALLTPEGERLAAALDAAFVDIRRAVDELTGADATRPLQVSTTPAFAMQLADAAPLRVPPRAPRGRADAQPDRRARRARARRHRRRRSATATATWRGLQAELLLPTTFVLVGAPALIGERRIAEPRDILDLPWLQELGTSEMSAWLRDRGVVARPGPRASSTCPATWCSRRLRNGDGVSLTTTRRRRARARRGPAQGRSSRRLSPGLGYFIVTRPGVMRPPLKRLRRLAAPPRPPAPAARLRSYSGAGRSS